MFIKEKATYVLGPKPKKKKKKKNDDKEAKIYVGNQASEEGAKDEEGE